MIGSGQQHLVYLTNRSRVSKKSRGGCPALAGEVRLSAITLANSDSAGEGKFRTQNKAALEGLLNFSRLTTSRRRGAGLWRDQAHCCREQDDRAV